MNDEQFLSSPKNRAAVEALSLQVLAEVEPDELEIATRFIGPLIDMAVRDEVVIYDPAHQAGGFGSADLMTSVIVPTIVSALRNLCSKLAGIDTQKTKSKEDLDKLIKTEVEKATEEMIRRTHSSKAKRKSKALKHTTTIEITLHIEQMNFASGDLSAPQITPQSGEGQVNVIRLTQSTEKGDIQTTSGDQVNLKRPSRTCVGDAANE
jgi:hypothetical protein